MIDLLSIQPNVISRDLTDKFILLAGKPKIGKTEFCCQAPNALILAFEIGTNARPGAMVQPVTKWSDFKVVLRQLEKPEVKEKFKVIAIDTIGIAYELCEQYICAQAGVQKINEIPFGGGYAQLSKEFESCLRKITMLGYGLLMTSHLKEDYDDEGHLIAARPDLNNRCLKIVNSLVDVIAVITQEWDEKGESVRWLQTKATPAVAAGSRYKYLAPKIPFGYNEFVKALGEAIDQEEAHGATVVDTLEKEIVKEASFKELMNEARELWDKLVTGPQDEQAATTILKKLEIAFGRPIRLSEITEDQKDILNLALIDMREMANK